MERLKDHINMHFIGQIKKGVPTATATESGRKTASPPGIARKPLDHVSRRHITSL